MIIKRRVKFIWGASKVVRGKWYFGLVGLYDRKEGAREDGLAVSVRGLLAWGGVMALLGWVALATAGFWFWQRNPYSTLTYSDAVLYPLRRTVIAEKKGQAYIAQGMELVRKGGWFDGVNLLRLGLARYPRDQRARLVLAQFHQLTNQPTVAIRILTDGLGDEYPGRSYAQALVQLGMQGEDFEAVVAMIQRLQPLAKRQGLVVEERWLRDRHYAALTGAGRHAEARVLVEAESSGDWRDERRVLSLLAAGQPTEALVVLAEWRARPGVDVRVVCRLEARAQREARQFDAMERALAEVRQRSPADPGALAFGVVQRTMAGLDATAGLKEYLFRFGGFAENLNLVAAPLAELGQLDLLRQCVDAARERGFPLQPMQVHLINAHVGRGEWADAARVLAELPPVSPKDPLGKPWRDWLQALLAAAQNPGDLTLGELLELLRSRAWSLEVFRRSADVMRRAGQLETAREIADQGLRGNPVSKSLQTLRADVQQELSARAAAGAAEPAAPTRGPDVIFMQRLEALLRAKDWAAVEAHIAQVEKQEPRPAWFEGREPAIRIAQVRMAKARRDLAAMVAAARAGLNGSVSRGTEMLEIAQEFFAAGDQPAALALGREVAERTPGFAAAARAVREWESGGNTPTTAGGGREPAQELSREALVAQLRERRAAGDVPGIRSTARLLLTGDRTAAEQALLLVREWAAAGDRTAADLLLKEVLQRYENFPPARRLQQELAAGAKK